MNEHNVNLHMVFKNTQPTEPIKDYARDKVSSVLKKFIHQDTEVHIVLDVEKNRQIVEVSFNCFGSNFTCKKESENIYKSIDEAVGVLGTQLRKQKEKATSHH